MRPDADAEPSPFQEGDRVRVRGEKGSYKVYRTQLDGDGSQLLYGGDPNPNGVRYYRSVMPNRLVFDKRRRKKDAEV